MITSVRKASNYGAPFGKILYLTDLAQKLLSLRIFSYLCGEIVSLCAFSYLCAEIATISAHKQLSLRTFSYLCTHLAISARI